MPIYSVQVLVAATVALLVAFACWTALECYRERMADRELDEFDPHSDSELLRMWGEDVRVIRSIRYRCS